MYLEHEAFKKPHDNDAIIWRYMSFTKFASLITNRSLFFASIAELRRIDPFEGTLPRGNQESQATRSLGNEQARERYFQHIDDLSESFVGLVVVNCWHMNATESAAMWKLYLPGGEGIAIRSSFERLSNG